MIGKHLKRNPSVKQLFQKLKIAVKHDYGDFADVHFDNGYACGSGATSDKLPDHGLCLTVGIRDLFLGNPDIRLRKFTQVAVAAFHEGRHVERYVQMKSDPSPILHDLSMNHLACNNNNQYEIYNWHRLIKEWDAERYAISNAGQFLQDVLDDDIADRLMLQYVNSRIENSDYFIEFPKGKFEYDDINDVLQAFDNAYESVKHCARKYDKNWSKCTDEAFIFAKTEMSQSACDKLFDERDGIKQDAMMVAITLYQHPEYQGWHKSLQYMDLSMDAQFGPDWQGQDSAKPKRRLPDVDLPCDGQQSEYEF